MASRETTRLGPLTVSRLCLGTMLMGDRTPAGEAHRMLDRFADAGGTFVDTADVYGDGESERVLAPWLARRRNDVVLATKVGMARPSHRARAVAGSRPRRVRREPAAHGNGRHRPLPGPRARPGRAARETLEALDGLVRAGKVRALGASNYPAWLLAWAVALQDRHGWSPFVSLQAQYSLVERSVEVEALPFCRAAGLGVLPWGPLGAGFLSGRHRRGQIAPGSRMATAADDLEEAPARRASEGNFRVLDAAEALAAERGATVPQVAIAWLLSVEGVSSPIIGPRTLEQLEDLLGGADVRLTAEDVARLQEPAPPPDLYPQRMLSEQVGLERVTGPLRR